MCRNVLKLIFLLLGIIAFVQPSSGQTDASAMRALMENLDRAGCNTNPYELGNMYDTPTPKGYKPFYITHYGRHGSRSNYDAPSYAKLQSVLESAKSRGLLTQQGDSLLTEVGQIIAYHDGMSGHLTPRGIREHEGIAERMYSRFPDVFKGRKSIRAVSSTVPRCLVSMNAFTNTLVRINPELDFDLDSGEKIMTYIDATRGRQQITMGSADIVSKYCSSVPDDTLSIMPVLFTKPAEVADIVPSPSALTEMVWCAGITSGVFDMPHTPLRFLTAPAIYKRWARTNLGLYLDHCNSYEYGAERVALAKISIDEMVQKADEAISGGQYAADLRFGHDFPLLSILCYIGIEGVGERLKVEDVTSKWWGFRNIQMATNVQAVFYRNKSGDVLVKFLFQEQEVLLRKLTPLSGPYYRWSDVKANLEGYLR